MKPKLKSLAVGTFVLTSVAFGVTVVGAPASTADSCWRHPAIQASNPTELWGNQLGVFGNWFLGHLQLSYIPDCRAMYAVVSFENSKWAATSGGSIWIEDAFGNQAGKIYTSGEMDAGHVWKSDLVRIDNFGYYYSKPRLHVGWVIGSNSRYPVCRPTDFYGNWHDFTGNNGTDHNWQVCGV